MALGASTSTEECNDRPCANWSPWGSWSSCSATCGDGTRTRDRRCDVLQENVDQSATSDNDNSISSNFGLRLTACEGEFEDRGRCNLGDCLPGEPSSFQGYSVFFVMLAFH